ncbi:hypothetical protein CQ12_09235 [Bradyrhizobium jicamae]|uniref:Uncharacterized protein n=1 Tax=Bradyrhizobium jicamae TaxID=280332 RepID=A0A0R3M6X4_9BRAD|nr:hypothetical protein [Bradyrhizobium jicamae]KRR13315.1 hypothetical protein CQ12_09235 [Bradyrhizobium jicamae]
MAKIVILFALTLALNLALKFFVAPRYGKDVAARFLEHLKYIPSQDEALSQASLARWLADKTQSGAISGYVFPVLLFPLDILFLICLGLFLGFASVPLAERLELLSSLPSWIWWILPMCYMASDIAENTVIAAIFKSFVPLSAKSFRLLSTFTTIKIRSVKAAICQVAVLGALNVLSLVIPFGMPI